ncbi:MAG TPA: hypothetical protein VGI65_04305 [Steroidobacteraceae bacterium]|jgi:hypothetical protein
MKATAPTPLFKKLNLGEHDEIVVLDAPESFETELGRLKGVKILRNPKSPKAVKFALAFAVTQAQLDRGSAMLAKASEGDSILWFAYPKGTSKRYSCEFNRDNGWGVIRGLGFESVRQVAIDDDWSALRFRRVEFVKS